MEKGFAGKRRQYRDEERKADRARLLAGQEVAKKRHETEG
jgi:hypothetical protein